jgi:hypothetical protein
VLEALHHLQEAPAPHQEAVREVVPALEAVVAETDKNMI